MTFAKRVFAGAGIWGLLILVPIYFMFDTIGRQYPPPITHPEHFYGFLAITLAWQLAFLTIATDPIRFRPLMLASIVEKFGFVATLLTLYAQSRLAVGQLAVGAPDVVWGMLFITAFFKTSSSS